MSVAPGLLEILACPRCKSPLTLTRSGDGLGCPRCQVSYPVTDGIPVLIFDEAVPWTPGGGPGGA